ncbi:MAG: S9 family peptidase, partial [Acidobacteriota bacterium]
MLSMLFSIPRPAAGPQFDRSRSLPKLCLALLFASLLLAPPASADGSTDPIYRTPPQELVDMIDAPLSPWVLVTPDERQLLIMDWTMLSDIEELSEPELKLAGRRIKPRNNGPSRTRPFTGMRLQSLEDKAVRPVTGLPAKLRFTNVRFAPGGRHASFTRTVAEGIELWVLDLESASARRLTEPVVSLTADEAPEWLDAETLVLALVPEDRGLPPQKEAVPRGPVIQENLGQKAPARTFQDLLGNTHDEALFDFYFTSQLARVDLGGKITKLGDPAVFWGIDPSPDGRYVLVDILHRPYSYLVPIWRFPMRTEIWTRDGAPMRQIYDRPLQENIPIARGSVATGPRDVSWRSDAPATAAWVEALDGGDAGAEAEVRDKLMTLAAPFRGEAQEIARFGLRFGGIQWGRDDLAIAGEWWWPTRKLRTWRVFPGEPGRDPVLMQDRSWEDRYSDPGDTVTKVNAWGREVLDTGADGDALFRIGDGASPEGDRPFLDRYDLETGEVERLFRSEAPYYEEPMEVLDDGGRYVLTRRESVDEVPDYYVRDLKKDRITRVTEFPHPTPLLQGMHKELVKYQRSDGVDLNATLYLPPGHDPEKDDPLPMVMWAYPREFKSAAAAGQIDDSPYRFTRIGWWSPVIWVTQGYAVLDDPKMPIIGEGDSEPNDR